MYIFSFALMPSGLATADRCRPFMVGGRIAAGSRLKVSRRPVRTVGDRVQHKVNALFTGQCT